MAKKSHNLLYDEFESHYRYLQGRAVRSARWAHNPEAVGSNPTPATTFDSLITCIWYNVVMRFITFVAKSLDTVISPMVYIMTTVSVAIGFGYTFLTGLADIQNSLLFKSGIPGFRFSIWGALLLVASLTTLSGLVKKKRWLVEPGASLAFMLWCFAALTYLVHGFFFAFATFALFHMVFYGYVYLASSLGVIQRVARNQVGLEQITNDD